MAACCCESTDVAFVCREVGRAPLLAEYMLDAPEEDGVAGKTHWRVLRARWGLLLLCSSISTRSRRADEWFLSLVLTYESSLLLESECLCDAAWVSTDAGTICTVVGQAYGKMPSSY